MDTNAESLVHISLCAKSLPLICPVLSLGCSILTIKVTAQAAYPSPSSLNLETWHLIYQPHGLESIRSDKSAIILHSCMQDKWPQNETIDGLIYL